MSKLCLSIKQVDLLFGKNTKAAFKALDQGRGRDWIHKELGQVVAVHQASFDVQSGEILVLMGLSGSGKSSLLRCINGMNGRGLGTIRGEILFHTENHPTSISKCSNEVIRKLRQNHISMVFQQFGLMPWRTVFQNIAYPLELQKKSRDEIQSRVTEKIKLVGLSKWTNHRPSELSGGMQQRVGLARAFVTDAQLLLMDEPFSALDPLHRKHLQSEVLDLQRALKKTILFVSHDFSEATRIATRLAIMESGKILQLGTPDEVRARPSCERVREFIAN